MEVNACSCVAKGTTVQYDVIVLNIVRFTAEKGSVLILVMQYDVIVLNIGLLHAEKGSGCNMMS